MSDFPAFGIPDYSKLLSHLNELNLPALPVSRMRDHVGPGVFLRHDIDFSLELAMPLARAEAEKAVCSTFYVLLSGPYDLKNQANRRALHQLRDMNHEIGLHYDLRTYPESPDARRDALLAEIRELETLIGCSVKTITMHEPHRNFGDPFQEETWVHPHREEWFSTVHYISDSCRAWRDDGILRLQRGALPRALLLTHPELWLHAEENNRLRYLANSITPHVPPASRRYFEEEVPSIWTAHLGPWKHDLREELKARKSQVVPMTRDWVDRHMNTVLDLFKDTPELPWGPTEILMDVEGKWDVSAALLVDGVPVAASFNSVRESHLYVHSILTAKNARGQGLGGLLLQALKIHAREKFEGILLRVSDSNTHARAWYDQHGFQPVLREREHNQTLLRWEHCG